jgi:hypothetical protein
MNVYDLTSTRAVRPLSRLARRPGIGTLIIVVFAVLILSLPAGIQAQYFIRGDANGDGVVNEADVCEFQCVVYGGSELCDCSQVVVACPLALDANDDGRIDSSDLFKIVSFLMLGGSAPPPPYPNCGPDPTDPQQGESCCDPWGDCCVGMTGNVDNDPEQLCDVGDVTALIQYLYIPPYPQPACMPEANIDGDASVLVDIGDLTTLIQHLYIPPNPDPAQCP